MFIIVIIIIIIIIFSVSCYPQWGTADAEIKNPLVGAKGYQGFPFLSLE